MTTTKECIAGNAAPSATDWAYYLPHILKLYYIENKSLHQTQDILQREHGFTATRGAYRSRLRIRGVQPKRLSIQKYRAMYQVSQTFAAQCTDVYFVGIAGVHIFMRTLEQIRQRLHGQPVESTSVTRAFLTLKLSCIYWVVTWLPDHTARRLTNYEQEASDLCSTTISNAVSRAFLTQQSPNCVQDQALAKIIPSPYVRTAFFHTTFAADRAGTFFIECFESQGPDRPLLFSSQIAMAQFRLILADTKHEFALCQLNWICTVLATSNQTQQIRPFIHEACEALSQLSGTDFPLLVVYRYLLAFCDDDADMSQAYGSYFERQGVWLASIRGLSRLNHVVSRLYAIWHLMSIGRTSDLLLQQNLQDNLLDSERTIGVCSLVSINNLVIMGRSFVERGRNQDARAAMLDALRRLDDFPPLLDGYRTMIAHRLQAIDR